MTELEDRLRRVLGDAARQVDVEPPPWRGAGTLAGGVARWAPRPGSLLAAAGVAVAVAVAVVAIVLGSAGRDPRSTTPAGGTPTGTGPSTPAAPGPRRLLAGNAVGPYRFGQTRDVLAGLSGVIGAAPRTVRGPGLCGLDGTGLEWRVLSATPHRYDALALYFRHNRFVGYSYAHGGRREATTPGPGPLATTRGLVLGATVATGRKLYGKAFHTSAAQGGSWSARTPHGTLTGYAYGRAPAGTDIGPHSRVESIEAGDVGCPAMTP
jgi:hypothetical protein